MDTETHKQIEDQAAVWLARRDASSWSPDDEARLHEWIGASVAHRVAFLRLEAAWNQAGRLKALGAGLPAGVAPPRGKWRHSPFYRLRPSTRSGEQSLPASAERSRHSWSRRRIALAGAAASLIAITAVSVFLMSRLGGEQYSTPVGGMAAVPLRDGSQVTLDTASRIRVELRPRERRVDLLGGEAFFVVAKDPRRPFVVQAGNARIVAVGTQFSVRSDHGGLRVVVTQGTVRLDTDLILLHAGSIARVTERGVQVERASSAQLERLLSWREGYLTFHETTLADAVAEFNRYNIHKISIADPRVARIRVSGTFRPTHVQAFVRLLGEGFSVRAIQTDENTTMLVLP
jgi:transmembrane sensor